MSILTETLLVVRFIPRNVLFLRRRVACLVIGRPCVFRFVIDTVPKKHQTLMLIHVHNRAIRLRSVTLTLLQIFIHWAEYKMTTPRDCSDSYLALYERTTSPTDRQRLYCDATSEGGGGDRRTASNVAYLRLYASSVDLLPRFRVVYTPFLTGEIVNLFCASGISVRTAS